MGKSTSCFKIITCGGDSADKDDLLIPSENKGSSENRGWSFRKRSGGHRVLSNTAISEIPSANKESLESTSLDFQPPDTCTVPEKISMIECTDEKPQLSISVESNASETINVIKDEHEFDTKVEESVVIVIQAAVRGLLAQKELLKLKNVVKLQAAVRGHLVRQHAIGTLRCVQAIVKMQALVRARHARLLLDDKKQQNSTAKSNLSYTSLKKLLANSFARQLMESTPKTKAIHIKCDPSKPNSAWNWLERWMAVTSAEPTPIPESKTEQLEEVKNEELETQKNDSCASSLETTVSPEGFPESGDSKSDAKETVLPSETDKNLTKCDADDLKFDASQPISSFVGDDLEQPETGNISTSDAKETSVDINALPSKSTEFNINSQPMLSSVPHMPDTESEQPDALKCSMKMLGSEELESEGKKFVIESRMSSNPTLIAAQPKFEEMRSTANSSTSFSPSHQGSGFVSNMDTVLSGADAVTRTKMLELEENSVPHNLRTQYGGSECGTDLSVASTLDLHDTPEVRAAENEHESKVLQEETYNADNKDDMDAEANDASTVPVLDVSPSVMDHTDIYDGDRGESVNPIVAADSPHMERRTSEGHIEVDPQVGSMTAYKSSPEASPRSHLTVHDSHGTPSSQVSVNAKKNLAAKGGSNQKRKLSASKRSPSKTNPDSGARSSMEQLPKDQNTEKVHNSSGLERPDHSNQDPGDSSSSSTSLPHFMQATESARAKINANNSPRSSPDAKVRDYIKKRHSLPGANGRQGSPRIQRLVSPAQHSTKGNGSHVVHEKKWQR